jgi:hypothetical protein
MGTGEAAAVELVRTAVWETAPDRTPPLVTRATGATADTSLIVSVVR